MPLVRSLLATVLSLAAFAPLAACGDNDENVPPTVDAAVDAPPPIDAPPFDP
ncbi:MAG: MspA protein, partial [Deltaproteobacteria bacterium]|nr:MspA protein [Deltaproteobacteria bacterium]